MFRSPRILSGVFVSLLGVVLACALPVAASAGTITGRVTSIVDGHALTGASVTATGATAWTDGNGYYTLYGVASGTVTVTASTPGFLSRALSVSVGTGASTADVQLATGGRILGHVSQANGAAAAGASVTLRGGMIATTVTLTADLNGNYASNWIAVGNYSVTATAASGAASLSAPLATGQLATVNLTLNSNTTISNIQNLPSWDNCSALLPSGAVCAAGLGNAVYWMAENQTTPSLSGSSAQFHIEGPTAYSNALWWKQLTPAPTATHFQFDYWVYLTNPSAPQALEFDMNQTVNSTKYIFGTQCDFRDSKLWEVWDAKSGRWQPSHLPCTPFQANAWSHFTWNLERANGMVHYISLAINGVTYPIDMWEYGRAASASISELNVAVQLDGNWQQQPYSIWVDKMSVTYW